MHWEIHITEFQNVEGKLEPNENAHSRMRYKLREYNAANVAFNTLLRSVFGEMTVFHNGLTKVGISNWFENNRWYMIALTLEKGWA